MRIFLVIEASTNLSITSNQTWLRNLYEPLVDLGHDVVLFSAEPGRKAMQKNNVSLRSIFSQKLFDTFSQEHSRKPFELFFAYLMDGMIDPQVIDQIKKKGVITTNFSCNNVHQFKLVSNISLNFDVNLHSEKDVGHKFISIGANSLWWPMASNPNYFKPQRIPRTLDISFVGGNYGIRAQRIYHLLENGADVHVFGPGWQGGGASTPFRSIIKRIHYLAKSALALSSPKSLQAKAKLADHDLRRHVRRSYPNNVHPPVSDEELISLYSSSIISLGFLEVYDNHDPSCRILHHLHLREFEAPMCGAFYCADFSEELAEMFEPDKEIVTYREEDELISKIRYYLKNQSEAEKIRLSGRERALKDHTYHKRFNQLFGSLGLK